MDSRAAHLDLTWRGKKTRVKSIVHERVTLEPRPVPGPTGDLAVAHHAFRVPGQAVAGEGLVTWRIELRTRQAGPDYRTTFPLTEAPEDDEEIEEADD